MFRFQKNVFFLLSLLVPICIVHSQDTNSQIIEDAIKIVKSKHIDSLKLSKEELLHAALRGIIKKLGPNAQFHSPFENQSFKQKHNGQFIGFGLVLEKQKSNLVIKDIIKDSPGHKSGLLIGDIVTDFDNVSLSKKSLLEINEIMKGDVNSSAAISIVRGGKPLTYNVTRDLLKLKTINDPKVLPNTNIGYLRISKFSLNTPDEFKTELIKLYEEGITGLIIDLRNNGGGSLSAALKLSSYFVTKGDLILYTQGKTKTDEKRFFSRGGVKFMDMPVIILINSKTASAAEIFSSCLRDYDKTVIIGQKSYGKGTVQSVYALKDGSSISFTIAKYYTRSGTEIEGKGIKPDIYINSQDDKDLELEAAISTFNKIFKKESDKDILEIYKSIN